MNPKITIKNLKTINYKDAFEYQEKLFYENIDKKQKGERTSNYLLFCEHPHVYTLGKSGSQNNLLINDNFLKRIDATFVKTTRGGDITYHGYGQIVIYPIFDLANFDIMAKKYIFSIEQAIIDTLAEYQITGERLAGASGIWLTDRKIPEKICALGVRISRGVTMHGLAFNINTDLSYFTHINPCGFQDKGVTSLQKELGKKIELSEVIKKLEQHFIKVFSGNS